MRKKRASPLSLMSQTFGHRAFVVFFLASVVPLALLALTFRDRALPESSEGMGFQAAIFFTALLVLASFYVLRHATREATAEMAAQNERLRSLVAATHSLTSSEFVDTIAQETLASSVSLCSAPAGLLFFDPDPSRATSVPKCIGNGAEEILERHRAPLMALAERVRRESRGALIQEEGLAAGDLAGAVEAFGGVTSLLAAPLIAPGRTAGVVVCFRRSQDGRFVQADLDLLLSLARQAGIAIDNAHLIESEKNFFTHVTQLLVGALDRLATHQPGHSRRVAHYAVAVGRELGLDAARSERLFFAALLHDIGMLRVGDGGAMSQERYREHARFGYEMIQPITLWSDLAPMVLHHQEHFDGQGYPEGIAGEEIPLEARIIGLAEAFDTMTSRHSYRPPRPLGEVMREIDEQAGKQFDPVAAGALAALVERGEVEVAEA